MIIFLIVMRSIIIGSIFGYAMTRLQRKHCEICSNQPITNPTTIEALNEDTSDLPSFQSVEELNEHLNKDEALSFIARTTMIKLRKDDNPQLHRQELLALLEDAIKPQYIWLDDNGDIINMHIAIEALENGVEAFTRYLVANNLV
jgi:uncharacterized protein YneF (UPF0154 family)